MSFKLCPNFNQPQATRLLAGPSRPATSRNCASHTPPAILLTRPPVATSPALTGIPTRVRPFCVCLTGLCFLRVFAPLHLVKSFLPFLPWFFALSYVLVVAFALTWLAFAFAFILLAFALAGLAFARPPLFGYFASIRFSFDSLSPCDRKFHTMNSFFGTCLGCPSPTNPSVQAVRFFVLVQHFITNFVHSLVPAVLINN